MLAWSKNSRFKEMLKKGNTGSIPVLRKWRETSSTNVN